MALGGGNWLTQNKVLPGSYINFSSVAKASATLSDRGYAAAPFVLSWGPEGEVFPCKADFIFDIIEKRFIGNRTLNDAAS